MVSFIAALLIQAIALAATVSGQNVIVKMRPGASLESFVNQHDMQRATNALNDNPGPNLEYAGETGGDGEAIWRVPEGADVNQVMEYLRAMGGVAEVEEEIWLDEYSLPNDPLFPAMWGLGGDAGGSRAATAWDDAKGSDEVVVAIVDSGALFHHEDLRNRWVQGYDMISSAYNARDGDGRDDDASDPGGYRDEGECGGARARSSSWHGSHVAGTIGASTNNGKGVSGMTWNGRLQPVRVLGRCGGSTGDIEAGIRWAAGKRVLGTTPNKTPAKVINLSLGGRGECVPSLQRAIDDAKALGAVIVVAAGNSNMDASEFLPANCDGVIVVGATDSHGERASFSNHGTIVDLSGPGVSIWSTVDAGKRGPVGDHYARMSGTSMAAPHVSGAVALLASVRPELSHEAAEAALVDSVRPFPRAGGVGECTTALCGAGLLDVARMIEQHGVQDRMADVHNAFGTCCAVDGENDCGECVAAGCGTCCSWTPDGCTPLDGWAAMWQSVARVEAAVEELANAGFTSHTGRNTTTTDPNATTTDPMPCLGLSSADCVATDFVGGNEFAGLFNLGASVDPTTLGGMVMMDEEGIPVHGNWCGPGHGGGSTVDAIDRVCKRHDKCYGSKGYLDCRCDRALVNAMPDAIQRTGSATAKAKGALILSYFSVSPCACRHQVPCGVRCDRCKTSWGVPYPCRCSAKYCTVPTPSCCGVC